MIREREVAAQICHHWVEELDRMREAVKRLSDVLRDDTFDDCSHEITAINEAQDSASRLQAACNLMRCGIGRAFPTEQEVSARPNGEKAE